MPSDLGNAVYPNHSLSSLLEEASERRADFCVASASMYWFDLSIREINARDVFKRRVASWAKADNVVSGPGRGTWPDANCCGDGP